MIWCRFVPRRRLARSMAPFACADTDASASHPVRSESTGASRWLPSRLPPSCHGSKETLSTSYSRGASHLNGSEIARLFVGREVQPIGDASQRDHRHDVSDDCKST
eukprot:scaffold259247_cov34-Tisochrysis_lutea.AAC.4